MTIFLVPEKEEHGRYKGPERRGGAMVQGQQTRGSERDSPLTPGIFPIPGLSLLDSSSAPRLEVAGMTNDLLSLKLLK